MRWKMNVDGLVSCPVAGFGTNVVEPLSYSDGVKPTGWLAS
jgi:hypothetical protein